MINLFPDEKIISSSDKEQVILTSHRICYEYKEWGKSYNQSIMLEHITSCENYSFTKYWLLILAFFSFAFTVFSAGENNEEGISIGVIITIILIFIYFLTRKSFVIIGSPSTKMEINVKGMKRDKVLFFINEIEHAKHSRLLNLNKNKG